MKEWLAWILAVAIFDRRQKRNPVLIDRRRITSKRSQEMLSSSIARLEKSLRD